LHQILRGVNAVMIRGSLDDTNICHISDS